MMADETAWQPISTVPNQTSVLVCNDCLLGWHAVAIQSALNEWFYDCLPSTFRLRLEYAPTHWQELPSVHPISLRGAKQ
jgi:hypothetical protein